MRPRWQFSLQTLLAAVAAVAVLLSIGRVAGVEAVTVVSGLVSGVLILTVTLRADDVGVVPAGVCGLLLACLITFPPLLRDWDAINLWMGVLIVAVALDIVGHRARPRQTAGPNGGRPREANARAEVPSFVTWMAVGGMTLSFLMLVAACRLVATEAFQVEAARAWQEYGAYSRDPPVIRACRPIYNTWFAHVLLLLALVRAARLRWRSLNTPGAEILLRRVANAHVLSLLAIAVLTLDALQNSLRIMSSPPRAKYHFFPAFYIAVVPLPYFALWNAVLLVVLGRRCVAYVRRYAWMFALGVGAIALAVVILLAAGPVVFPELR